ncbi:uncharacterized protein LOC129772461 [Toxorhynchites rutilus septentrionalis]|uniref:uncharacterized protein LOC129772461 n=1 Tax=Toxorhynchites rutilus septentrionalis TaxID=329112 RepID=UPI00247A79AA|nr:uncharacterized protein LOC129772461 [Toxorhynchites rutilus septentrionalis]
MNRKHFIYVENISPGSTEDQLMAYLAKWSPVQQVYFLREKQCTKRSIAAFVRVASAEDLEQVMTRNQQNYRGKRLFMVTVDQPQFFQADLSVIVRNITSKISEENLFEHFEDCGKITFLQIRTNDFAYVCFQDKAGVRNAMLKNNMPLKGANLKIQLLTRNVEIMIVNLDTLPNRMPDLYRMMCLPVEIRRSERLDQANQQTKQEPVEPMVDVHDQQQQSNQPQQGSNQVQQQPQRSNQPQQQQQQRSNQSQQQQQQRWNQPQQQQQQRPNKPQQQQQQQQRSNQPQQQQQQRSNQPQQQQQQRLNQPQQQQQQRSNQPQQQQQQRWNQQQPQQRSNQSQQHNRQLVNQQQKQNEQQQQNKHQPQQQPLPQRSTQLNWFMRQQDSEPQPQQQNQLSAVQRLKEKANALVLKQQDLPPLRSPVTSNSPSNGTSLANGQQKPMTTAPIEEIVIIDDIDTDSDLPVPPIPSKYQPKPGDLMKPIKAAEIRMNSTDAKNPDVRAVWINNIDQEVHNLDIVRYMEQFGDVEHFKFGNSQNSFFTKWAKVVFTKQESALLASEYFLHPYNGRYLFVLSCTRNIEEVPERCFFADYLSQYIVYEDIVKAFKHVGEVFYFVRLTLRNMRKVRIFFTADVDPKAVLAVKSIGGMPVVLERFSKDGGGKISRAAMKSIRNQRDKIPDNQASRVAKVNEIRQQDSELYYSYQKEVDNSDSRKHSSEVLMINVPKTTTDQEIKDFFKEVGEPLTIRREPEPYDTSERIYVGFNTFSKVLRAIDLEPPINAFDGHGIFITEAIRLAKKTNRNAVSLWFEEPLTIQDIFNRMKEIGPIRNIEKQNDKQAVVVFKISSCSADALSKAQDVKSIGGVKIVKIALFDGKQGKAEKSDEPIVILDDDVEVVETKDAAKSENQGKPKPEQQPRQDQKQNDQQQNQNQQKFAGNKQQNRRVRNPFSGGNQQNRQQQNQRGSLQRGHKRNMWQQDEFGRDEPMHPFEREQHFMRNEQFNRFEQERRMQELLDNEFPPQFCREFDDRRLHRSRSPHQRGRFHDDVGLDWEIPTNIPEQDLDEYISRKQEAIQRRLEQLERQLVTSTETSREMDIYDDRRQETIFSSNGDVHYVPNPAARQRRGRGRGRPTRPFEGGNRPNRNENYRTRDPFSGLDIAPIIRENRSPSPKRSRGTAEEDFDTVRFNAAWS